MKSIFAPRARKMVSRTMTHSAPVGGLNVRDSIVSMPPQDAIVLTNMLPQTYGCLVRKGYKEHATGLTGVVESIMAYNNQTGTNVLLGANSGDIFDISTAGDYSAATPKYTGLSNNLWQHVNFSNSAGSHLVAFNGADDGIWVHGATPTYGTLTAGNGVDTGTINGVDPADVIHCCVHQRRLWLIPVGSTVVHYLPVDSVFGVVADYDLGPWMARGGYIMAAYTWTIDSGVGSDDHIAFITSEGEVIVYRGTDPSDAAAWFLAGVFYIGSPVARRCGVKYAGDLAVLTQFGLVSLSQALVSTKVENSPDTTYTEKVQPLISDLVSTYSSLTGWQIFIFPKGNMLFINIPVSPTEGIQLVMNTVTKAWCLFSNQKALCWELYYNSPFFGADGVVYRAWEGYRDGADSAGNGGVKVSYDGQSAFDYFKAPGRLKHFKMARPTFLGNGAPGHYFQVNTDFELNTVFGSAIVSGSAGGIWNTSYWNQAFWAGSDATYKPWGSVEGIGTAGSIRVKGDATGEAVWVSTDWVYEFGGVI